MIIRQNRIRRVIEAGGSALGCGVLTLSPSMVEAVGVTGIDFVWIDLEHAGVSPYDSLTIENIARAAEVAGVALMVRVPSVDEDMIGKVLDAGVHSILAPGIESKEDVEKLVCSSKYNPPGLRSVRGGPLARVTSWGAPDKAFAEESDRQIMVGGMLESKRAIDNLKDILSVKGLDFLFIGPVDLSISLGAPFQLDNPVELEYIAKAREMCKAAGMPLGRPVTGLDAAKKAVEEGYLIIRIGVDISIVTQELKKLVQALKRPGFT